MEQSELTPGIVYVTGEPTRCERVENRIKLTLSLKMRDGHPMPWHCAFVPFGVFCSVKTVDVLSGDVKVPWPRPEAPALLCKVDVLTAKPLKTSEDDKKKEKKKKKKKEQDDAVEQVALVPVMPCSRCASREVRKLALLTPAETTEVTKAYKKDKNVPFTQQLNDVMTHSMLVYHNEPEVSFGKSGIVSFTLRFRLICYSTHHDKEAFLVNFSLYDSVTGNLVAQQASKPIMVVDNHKNRSSQLSDFPGDVSPVFLQCPVVGLKRPSPALEKKQNPSGAVITAKIVPSSGSIAGGMSVVVIGSGYHEGCSISLGGVVVPDTHVCNDGTLMGTVPPGVNVGPVTVSVIDGVNEFGTSLSFSYLDDIKQKLCDHAFSLLESLQLAAGSEGFSALEFARNVLGGLSSKSHTSANESFVIRILQQLSPSMSSAESPIEVIIVKALEPLLTDKTRFGIDWCQPEQDTKRTLLHFAAMMGYCLLGTMLLNAAPELRDQVDMLGFSAMHYAVMRHRPDFVLLLMIRKANTEVKNIYGMTAAAYAASNNTLRGFFTSPLPSPVTSTTLTSHFASPDTHAKDGHHDTSSSSETAPLSTGAAAPITATLSTSSLTGFISKQLEFSSSISSQQPHPFDSPGRFYSEGSFLRVDDDRHTLEDTDPMLLFSREDERDDGWVIVPPAKMISDDNDTFIP